MKTILCDELKLIKPKYNSGNFSSIDIVEFQGQLYCFKLFQPYNIYPSDIIDNIGNLTEMSFSNEFLVPKYIVMRKNRIIGYLSIYKKNKTIEKINLEYQDKVAILKDAKEKLENLHKEYKIIHGDLNLSNILVDKNFNTSFIDFDSSLKFNQNVGSVVSFPRTVINYMKYFKYDYKADIYKFNLETLKFLYNIASDENILFLASCNLFNENSSVETLSKELILKPEKIKKEYSGEFIIDYID